MAHVPLFWLIAVGLVLAVGLVGGGLARMREQRRHVRAMLQRHLQAAAGAEGRPSTVAASRRARTRRDYSHLGGGA